MNNSLFIGRKVSSETRNWLIQNGIDFEENQLINIVLNKPDLSKLNLKNNPRQFIISSQWAAKWLVKFHSIIGFNKSDSVFCISDKQKKIVEAISDKIYVSKLKNAESLVELILLKKFQKQVVFLHGNLSLKTVETKLSNYIYGFNSLEVYRNIPVTAKIEKHFGTYLFFSPSGVLSFYKNRNRIPIDAEIITIGETTANTCRQLFNNEIKVSKGQDELSVIKCSVNQLEKKLIEI